MRSRHLGAVAARRWVRRFDALQAYNNPRNEERFEFILDMLAAGTPPNFRALELGAATGSFARRALDRFPRAHYVALDYGPVLPEIGRRATPARLTSQLTWVEADLRDPTWPRILPSAKFDAVITTTTLHWLSATQLRATYRGVSRILRKGGILLNGDRAILPAPSRWLRGTVQEAWVARRARETPADTQETWQHFWTELRREPDLESLFQEHDRRFSVSYRTEHFDHPYDLHLRYLRDAGFREAEVVWRSGANAVIAARK